MIRAMRVRSLKRLMERATIHSVVGVINGLRLSIYLLSHLIPQQHGEVTPPFTLRAMGLECDRAPTPAPVRVHGQRSEIVMG